MEIKSQKQTQLGFTLVELLVAMAIIGILATITITSFSQANKSRGVVLASDTILSILRSAQSLSLNPEPISGDTCAPDSIPVEYRAIFTSASTTYLINAKDKCNNIITVASGTLPNKVVVSPGNNMTIDSTGVGSSGGILTVKFTPPFGTTTAGFSATMSPFALATIKIQSADGQITKKIIIDGISGRFDVQ